MKKSYLIFTIICFIFHMGFCQSFKNRNNQNSFIPKKNTKESPFFELKNINAIKNTKNLTLKQDSVIRQYYDTINNIWYNNIKAEMNYDELGLNTQVLYSSWDNNLDVWKNCEKEEIVWNQLGLISQRIKMSWDNGLNQWVKVDTQSIIYNGNNDIIQIYQWNWDAILNQWVYPGQIKTTYNANNQITQIIESSWNSSNSNWETTGFIKREYDNNSNLVSDLQTIRNYSQNQLDTSYWNKYEFNIFNKVVKQEYYCYSTQNNNLKLHATYYYKYDINQRLYCDSTIVGTIPNNMISINLHYYDTNNLKIQTINQIWQWVGEYMTNYSKTDYSYNSAGKEILRNVYSWDENIWKISYKTEANYDINNIQDYNSNLIYVNPDNVICNNIQSGEKYHITFDPNYLTNQIASHYPEYSEFFFYFFGNKKDSIIYEQYNSLTESWYYISKNRYYYSGFGTDEIPKNETSQLLVYPNPATDYIFIDSKDLSTNASIIIYDSYGRMVINQPIKGKVSVKDLSKGIYFYTINSNKKVAIGKFLVE